MIRLHFVVEGQTEEEFVNTILCEHLGTYDIVSYVRCVETSRKHRRIYRGGMIDYQRAKKDIRLWMKEDQNPDARFTTMFDLYALPSDFPDFNQGLNQDAQDFAVPALRFQDYQDKSNFSQ